MNTLQIGIVRRRDNSGNMIVTKLEYMHMLVTHSTITWSILFEPILETTSIANVSN
jgi:hypothetical protein